MKSELKRSDPRLQLSVTLEYEGFERFHPDRTLNLSAGGMFVITPKPLPRGQRICFKFELPDLNSRVRACGSVIWSPGPKAAGSGSRHPMGMAIRFDGTEAKTREILHQYVFVKSALGSLDTRIGKELPAHLLSQLPIPEGKPEEVTLSEIALQLDL